MASRQLLTCRNRRSWIALLLENGTGSGYITVRGESMCPVDERETGARLASALARSTISLLAPPGDGTAFLVSLPIEAGSATRVQWFVTAAAATTAAVGGLRLRPELLSAGSHAAQEIWVPNWQEDWHTDGMISMTLFAAYMDHAASKGWSWNMQCLMHEQGIAVPDTAGPTPVWVVGHPVGDDGSPGVWWGGVRALRWIEPIPAGFRGSPVLTMVDDEPRLVGVATDEGIVPLAQAKAFAANLYVRGQRRRWWQRGSSV